MAFIDEITIHAAAGKGGNGVVRWLRTKGKDRGGPSGGDGGRGGDIILEGTRDLGALSRYRYEKKFHAEDGEAGMNNLKHGADGSATVLKVPVGTTARMSEGDQKMIDIAEEGERRVVFRGGGGGKGNAHFKGSTNQNPFHATPGRSGEQGSIALTLKLIADAGLVGLPNAGKSSLLNALTRARSKIGAYPFTTLEPALGSFYGSIIADIPGLIEGASTGRGLGIKFLKHVERTRIILHLVSASQDYPLEAYKEVRKELEAFGHALGEKPEIIVLSKIDLVSASERETIEELLRRETGREVLSVSVEDAVALKVFSDRLSSVLTS